MRKAIRLLTICIAVAALLAATAVFAAADAPDTETQAAPEAAAESVPDAAESGTDAEADPMAPVDVPAAEPAGTVYAVGSSGAIALTVVDYTDDGADAGVLFDGSSRYYYGAQITGADCGAVIEDVPDGYFGSSGGSIPLYDAKGSVTGIVWGSCRPTAVDCGVGFMLNGNVDGCILAEDGASFACREAVILCPTGSGSFRFHNARLSSETGVLLQMEPEAGAVSVACESGSYSGDLINKSDSPLTLTVGRGALLFGDTVRTSGAVDVTVATEAVWAVSERSTLTSLTIEEGGTVYGELLDPGGSSLILFPSDQVLEPGTYEAASLIDDLPMGHGPALPAEDATSADTEDSSAPEQDADRASKLFPLAPGPVISDENITDEELPAPSEDEADSSEDPTAADKDTEAPLEPAETASPAPEPSETPEPSEAPEPSDASREDTEDMSALPDVTQTAVRHSLLLGAGLASPSALSAAVGTVSPSLDFAARLAIRTTGQPPAACLLKTGTKTHSFLPQALDNQAIILYNPYCCSAA